MAGALPVTPLTVMGLSTVALSLIAKSPRFSKYLPGGGVLPTAFSASTRPSPKKLLFAVVPVQRLSDAGQARSVAWAASLARMSAGVMPGSALASSAATPATCGEAMEVPLSWPYLPPGRVL